MKDLKHIKRFNEAQENLNSETLDKSSSISDVSGSDFIEHDLEDENGNKFCVNLPKDAANIQVINIDNKIRVGFRTKFGGKKYLQTYVEV
jgi:hypothetical protein